MDRATLRNRVMAIAFDVRGVTAVEYGMMLAIFSLVVTSVMATLGTSLAAMFQRIVDLLA